MRLTPVVLISAMGCAPQLSERSQELELADFPVTSPEARELAGQALLMPLQAILWTLRIEGCGTSRCPMVEEDGDRTVLTGGCTDDAGTSWHGRVVLEQPDEDRVEAWFSDFGTSTPDSQLLLDGEAVLVVDDDALEVEAHGLDIWVEGPQDADDTGRPWSISPVALSFERYLLLADEQGSWSVETELVIVEDGDDPQLALLSGAGWSEDEQLDGTLLVQGGSQQTLGVGGSPDAPLLWLE